MCEQSYIIEYESSRGLKKWIKEYKTVVGSRTREMELKSMQACEDH